MHHAVRNHFQCLTANRAIKRLGSEGVVRFRFTRPSQRFTSSQTSQPSVTTIFSGIQPTGVPHLGNYLGALREWVKLQNTAAQDTRLIFSIVDLHALTVPQESRQLRKWRKEAFATLLAIGLDPNRSTIFFQSAVCWIPISRPRLSPKSISPLTTLTRFINMLNCSGSSVPWPLRVTYPEWLSGRWVVILGLILLVMSFHLVKSLLITLLHNGLMSPR